MTAAVIAAAVVTLAILAVSFTDRPSYRCARCGHLAVAHRGRNAECWRGTDETRNAAGVVVATNQCPCAGYVDGSTR